MGVLAVGGSHQQLPPLWLMAACVGCVVLGCNVCTLVPILGQRRGQIAAAKKILDLPSVLQHARGRSRGLSRI